MENYLKLFVRIFISIILSMTICSIVYFRASICENLRLYTEHNAKGLAQQFIANIWSNNQDVLSLIGRVSSADLYQDPRFKAFAVNSITMLRDLPVVKLNIYDASHNKFLSNNKITIVADNASNPLIKSLLSQLYNLLFKMTSTDNALSLAYKGQVYSQFMPFASFGSEELTSAALIQVLVPLPSLNGITNVPGGVMELFYDVSKEWNRLEDVQDSEITGAIAIFFIFLLILFFVSSKLEKLIEKQHEVNSELADAKAKAEAESSEKSKFLANISHELRTPLNAIIGFSDIIKTESLGPVGHPQYKEYGNDINNSGTHLLSLINDILDYSKAAAEKLQVEAIEVDISKILVTSMRLVTPRAEEAKVQLIQDIPPGSLVLIADPKRLKQAVLNLLSNSVKFTPENGSVTLSVRIENDNKLIIQVKDTGIGIADKDVSKAMASFGQVDSKLSRKYEGTGLGLPLTKKLVELMNGSFDLESEPGFGTTVTLSFPYVPPVPGNAASLA